MATTYPVRCECGATLQVPGTAAGTIQTCRCGRAVAVPSLVRLKASAGEAVVSAELELQHLLLNGSLPLEQDCVVCDLPTNQQTVFAVVCERPEEKGQVPVWQQFLLIWISPLLYLWHMASRRTEVHGRDVSFRLPVRVCEACRPSLRGRGATFDALCHTPVYARLLEKYPHASISNAA